MSNLTPFKPGEGGRPKGALNKSTVERNRIHREAIENSGIIGKLRNEMLRRITECPETIKYADMVKAYAMFGGYMYQTTNEEKLEEIISENMTREELQNNIINLIQKKAANQ